MVMVRSMAADKNKAVTADTAIYTAVVTGDIQDVLPSRLEVSFSVKGVLSINRNGVWEKLNGGYELEAGVLYAFDIGIYPNIAYDLKYSESGVGQIYWYWRTEE